MADPQPALSWPIIGAQVMSTVLTAGGQLQRGNAQEAIGQRTNIADQFQAAQLQQNASADIASGQVAAENQNMATGYIVSQAMARAAASGGGASDPTVINNIARIQAEGAYRANVARYSGQVQARTAENQAAADIFAGQTAQSDAEAAKRSAGLSAFATVLSGTAKTMAAKYQVGD